MSISCAWRSFSLAHRSQQYCSFFVQKRYRYKKKWAVNLPSKTNCELALEHFDAFYKPLYGPQWPSIRVSLLSLPKYAALINNASDAEMSAEHLARLGARDLIRGVAMFVHNASLKNNESHPVTSKEDAVNDSANSVTVEQDSSLREDTVDQKSERNRLGGESSSDMKSSVLQTSQILDDAEPDTPLSVGNSVGDGTNDFSDIGLENVLPPDALQQNLDLEHFMPSQQVFSETEQRNQAEVSQSVFQERPVSAIVLPGQLPRLPMCLKLMAFPRGNVSNFPRPKVDAAKLLSYYLLDAASVLPVLALDVHPHDNVLDLCAAPGGKTLALLQIIVSQGGHLTSNDLSSSRAERLKTVLRSYLSKGLESEFVTVKVGNGLNFRYPLYNKVLVDVPCNTDRHVLTSDENNLFKPGRINERLEMTSMQKQLLLAGIKSCKPGGSVVYSTCTLAAVQNDGVVQAAIEELWETSDIDVAVEDLSPLAEAFSSVFKFHSATRLGQLVLPSLVSNFGPMYFSKLRRLQ